MPTYLHNHLSYARGHVPAHTHPPTRTTSTRRAGGSPAPGGVVNLLTGFRKELVPTFATNAHLRAVAGVASAADRKTIETGAADSVKRVRLLPAEAPVDWFEAAQQGLYAIRDFVEFKTTWHPVGA